MKQDKITASKPHLPSSLKNNMLVRGEMAPTDEPQCAFVHMLMDRIQSLEQQVQLLRHDALRNRLSPESNYAMFSNSGEVLLRDVQEDPCIYSTELPTRSLTEDKL